ASGGRAGRAGLARRAGRTCLPRRPCLPCLPTLMRTPFIAGNWKMFKTVQEAVVFVKELRALVKDVADVEIVVAPPFTAIHAAAEAARNTNIAVAAQDLHWEREGAFTGEIAASMLKEAGAEYVIAGHAERR